MSSLRGKAKGWAEHHMFDDPEAHCHIPGVPRGTEQPPYPFEIIQDEKYFTILYEAMHDVRIIPMDHSPQSKKLPGMGWRFARSLGGRHVRRRREQL